MRTAFIDIAFKGLKYTVQGRLVRGHGLRARVEIAGVLSRLLRAEAPPWVLGRPTEGRKNRSRFFGELNWPHIKNEGPCGPSREDLIVLVVVFTNRQ